MTLISLVGVSKDFGLRTLFEDLDLHLQEGDRLGLIGPNGAGKSTLLRLLAGLEPPGEGERRCSGRLKVVMVAQEPDLDPERTVLEQVFEDSGEKMALLRRFTEVSQDLANDPGNQALLGELSDLQARMDQANAWSLEQQCHEVLERLGISDVHRRVGELSGGFRKRLALAAALVAEPDVLLLDEPTNHLDALCIEWLQGQLERFPGALVLITHDRYVLDRVARRIVEVDRGVARNYPGNYATYLQTKAEEEAIEAASATKFKGPCGGSWNGCAAVPRPAAPSRRPGSSGSRRCRRPRSARARDSSAWSAPIAVSARRQSRLSISASGPNRAPSLPTGRQTLADSCCAISATTSVPKTGWGSSGPTAQGNRPCSI